MIAYETVTIWNYCGGNIRCNGNWHRHVIRDCVWENDIIRQFSGDSSSIITGSVDLLISANERYKPYCKWKTLPFDEREIYFTLNVGDLVARGIFAADIGAESDEEAEIYTKSELRTLLFPNVIEISRFSDNSHPCKRSPHYHVKGK